MPPPKPHPQCMVATLVKPSAKRPLQKLQKQVSPFRSCTLCVQGSAQRQGPAGPHAISLSLPLGAHGAGDGPAPGLRCPQCGTCHAPHPGPPGLFRAYAPAVSQSYKATPAVARTGALLSQGGLNRSGVDPPLSSSRKGGGGVRLRSPPPPTSEVSHPPRPPRARFAGWGPRAAPDRSAGAPQASGPICIARRRPTLRSRGRSCSAAAPSLPTTPFSTPTACVRLHLLAGEVASALVWAQLGLVR